jgi:hypothetical protein
MAIILMAIGAYSIGGYWCLLMVIILVVIGGYWCFSYVIFFILNDFTLNHYVTFKNILSYST